MIAFNVKKVAGSLIIAALITSISINYFLLSAPESSTVPALQAADTQIESTVDKKSTQQVVDSTGLHEAEAQLVAIRESQAQMLDTLAYLKNQMAELDTRITGIENSEEPDSAPERELQAQLYAEDERTAYTLAEDDFYNQDVDPEWDAEMTMSLSNMETSLLEYANNSVAITSRECRQDSCRVVLTRQEDGPPLYPVMLSAQGASKMLFDSVSEYGVEKTVIIYQR